MVVVGQMSADQAAIMTLELLTMRDNAYAAKPNNVLVQAINASFNAGAGLVNRAVDVMYFDQLNALAEMFPKAGEAVGTYMLVSFKGAKTVSQVVGVGVRHNSAFYPLPWVNIKIAGSAIEAHVRHLQQHDDSIPHLTPHSMVHLAAGRRLSASCKQFHEIRVLYCRRAKR